MVACKSNSPLEVAQESNSVSRAFEGETTVASSVSVPFAPILESPVVIVTSTLPSALMRALPPVMASCS